MEVEVRGAAVRCSREREGDTGKSGGRERKEYGERHQEAFERSHLALALP